MIESDDVGTAAAERRRQQHMEEASLLQRGDDIGNDAPLRLDAVAGGFDLGHERLRRRNPIHLLSLLLEHRRSSTGFLPVYRSNLPLSALGQRVRAAPLCPLAPAMVRA
jgi:hypothetical protein